MIWQLSGTVAAAAAAGVYVFLLRVHILFSHHLFEVVL